MKAPFPYFGGKAKIAPIVWSALGQPAHYIEPFFGSGAVLLGRPDWMPDMTETINDADGFVANVWRALQSDPDAVAKHCDWPVNHACLIARKAALIKNENWLLENLCADAHWFDAEMAGYWVWAASCWIGSGLTCPGQIPHIGTAGIGVHAKGQIPHIGDAGKGVHAKGQIPHIGDAGMGDVREAYNTSLYAWFRQLSERLRYVRVVCGDWTRVCGGNWQDKFGTAGIFFDPPYGDVCRDTNLYHHDSTAIAPAVEAWCLARGDSPRYRIVVAGYDEYPGLIDAGWRTHHWKSGGGYANIASGDADHITQGKKNCHRETLYFSPHCLGGTSAEMEQVEFEFDLGEADCESEWE
jgi:hypothetical protein